MFEYGPDGRRRLSKFGQRVVVMLLLVAMVMVTTAYLVAHRQAGESTGGIITAGFALAGTLGMGVLTYGQGRRNEEILYQQNEKLEQIHGEAKVKEEQTAAVVRETYQAAIDTVVKEAERERHQLKGQNGILQGALKHTEGELTALREANAKLEAQARELMEKLGRVAEAKAMPGPRGEQGERGEKGDPGDANR